MASWNTPGAKTFAGRVRLGDMFSWAIAFLVIALVAGVPGFGVVAGTAFVAAKIVFVVALMAFLISGVVSVARRGAP